MIYGGEQRNDPLHVFAIKFFAFLIGKSGYDRLLETAHNYKYTNGMFDKIAFIQFED